MNDTESRLRDYFQTQAGTIPDQTQGPGLDLDDTPKRRGWLPITLAAAAIGAILVLTVPALTNLADKTPNPAGKPTGPVSAEAPKIPFFVGAPAKDDPLNSWPSVLHDGGKTVQVPADVSLPIGTRVGGGWSVLAAGRDESDPSQLGILQSNGQVRRLGPKGATFVTVSPDRRQLATAVPDLTTRRSRIIVVDVETGKLVSDLHLPGLIGLRGWNKSGIWLHQVDQSERRGIVWQPGSKTTQTVPGVLGRSLAMAADNEMIVDVTARGKTGYCARAGIPGVKGLDVRRKYCANYSDSPGGAAGFLPNAFLSPDGATMVIDGVAVDIATGKTVELQPPATLLPWPQVVFEDPTNLILATDPAAKSPQTMYRCSVSTGECKDLKFALKPSESIKLAMP